jgi:curved DNA-binding protein
MERRDPYEVIGVARDADDATLKKAYRRLARKLHPDVNPGDKVAEEKFKALSEAYAVLSDPEKRRAYDEFGDVSLQGGFDPEAARRARDAFGSRFGGGRGGAGGAGGPFEFDVDDLVGDLFSRRGWSTRGGPGGAGAFRMRGADLDAQLSLSLREAARGVEQRLVLQRPQADGSLRSETVTVRIPAGVADGGRIRVAGKGGAGGGGGPAGDLYATIRIEADPVFRLDGRDLHLDLPVTVREAVLGAKVEVPTLEGRATLQIPPGTDSGRRLRLRGKGMPNPGRGAAGDLYVTVQIRVPRELDDDAKSALDEIARFDPEDPRRDLFR